MAAAAIRTLELSEHFGLIRPTAAATGWSASSSDAPARAW
jgi:hypothetical protein